ncbi:hypothetical protein XEULMG905_23010, partial [Xanthomonas euvesicatoria]
MLQLSAPQEIASARLFHRRRGSVRFRCRVVLLCGLLQLSAPQEIASACLFHRRRGSVRFRCRVVLLCGLRQLSRDRPATDASDTS